jgi:midasin
MDCSTAWRLYYKLTVGEIKNSLSNVLIKYELKSDSVVSVSSRASEDLAAVIGSIFLSASVEHVLLAIEETRDWLTLAVASAARDSLHAAFERQQNFVCSSSLILPAAPHLSELIVTTLRDMPFPLKGLSLQSLNSVVALSVAPALYRLLLFDKELLSHLWDWGDAVHLLRDERSEIKCYAIEILSLLMNLPEQIKFKLRSYFVPDSEASACFSVALGELVENWCCRTQTGCHNSLCQREDTLVVDSSPRLPVVSITGIHLTVPSHLWQHRMLNDGDSPLVLVPSCSCNLRSLVLALSSTAVLLEGPVGSGKTLLVQHLAALLGRSQHPFLMRIQLGGHTDSKALIGMYQCSDRPGEFVWQAGPLTEAVRKGYWILLEDIDCAPAELISMLLPLIETGRLAIPGQGATVKAAPGFQLIATQCSVSLHGQLRHISSSHWSRVLLAAMNKDDLAKVIMTRFPGLRTEAYKLVEVYSLFCAGSSEARTDFLSSQNLTKHLSLRDLVKLCKRLVLTSEGQMITSTVALLQDVIDCFLAYTQSPEKLISAAITVGALFGFNKDKVEYICSSMKPSIEVSETHITIGRSTLPKMTPSEKYDPTQHCAFTRHALVLLEQLAVCVHHSEPVLLVGDTGTGKTSAVQHLARLTGHKLTVLNLSQQSDSSDLLGGFQPVNVSRVVGRVKDHFLDLFHCTFSVVQNIRFLRHIQDSYVKNDWKTILRLMHHCFLSAKKRAGSCGRLKSQWHAFGLELERLTMKLQEARTSFAFDFVEVI